MGISTVLLFCSVDGSCWITYNHLFDVYSNSWTCHLKCLQLACNNVILLFLLLSYFFSMLATTASSSRNFWVLFTDPGSEEHLLSYVLKTFKQQNKSSRDIHYHFLFVTESALHILHYTVIWLKQLTISKSMTFIPQLSNSRNYSCILHHPISFCVELFLWKVYHLFHHFKQNKIPHMFWHSFLTISSLLTCILFSDAMIKYLF